jgi:hypothetical protein
MAAAGGPTTTVVDARLPHGLLTGDTSGAGLRRTLPLRAVDDRDNLFLLDTGELPPLARATVLLARCLGNDAGSLVADLTLGDREALLLQLRSRTVGPELAGVVTCPDIACRAMLEFRVLADDLVLPPYDGQPEPHETQRADGTTIAFRLPRVGDVEAGLAEHPDDAPAARRLAISRCVDDPTAELSDADLDAVAEEMAALDPQAELQVELTCVECELAFWFLLDTGAFLMEELDARTAELVAEVHQLASAYHWSEADILSMSPARRAVYLDLLERLEPAYDVDLLELSQGMSTVGSGSA